MHRVLLSLGLAVFLSAPLQPSSLAIHSEADDLAWAQAAFAAAGLQLPPFDVVVRADTSECNWRRGLYDPDTDTIIICHMNRDTVVHEIAHAWVDANLQSSLRTEFLRLRGLSAWNDHSFPWAQRGTEHAAAIVAWAVQRGETMVTWVEDGHRELRLLAIPKSSVRELRLAYRLLTGVEADVAGWGLDSEGDTVTSPEESRAR